VAAALTAAQLCRVCDPASLGFRTTEELADLAEPPGQRRAQDAISFAIDVAHGGYNLFVMGSEGHGRRSMIRRVLGHRAGDSDASLPPSMRCRRVA